MKKILITGAGGFIGKNLVEYLSQFYNVSAPRSSQLDLLDTEKTARYLSQHKFNCVIHCAAEVMSRNYQKDPSLVLERNLRMFFNLARCSNVFNRMFYFGSGAEYDMRHYKNKMPETYFDTYIPEDQYGFSKYISAKYISADLKIFDLRLFGCYGKYENWEVRFISNAICKVVFDLDITMNQNVFFDYLYVNDLGKILQILIEKKQLEFQHFNVCTGTAIDLKTLAEKIIFISGKKKKLIIKNKGLKQEYSGDNKRLVKELGKKFQFTPIEIAIAELYEWYNTNKNVIDKKKLLFDK